MAKNAQGNLKSQTGGNELFLNMKFVEVHNFDVSGQNTIFVDYKINNISTSYEELIFNSKSSEGTDVDFSCNRIEQNDSIDTYAAQINALIKLEGTVGQF